ncbi:MAG: thiopeptide-type bacteriocin biosynthesis protein [Myxococcales bacterium]|nr:thiopeptide-type bacteriocin biosynthesis protein [Myxococcales bacterium]
MKRRVEPGADPLAAKPSQQASVLPVALLRVPLASSARFLSLSQSSDWQQDLMHFFQSPLLRRALRAKSPAMWAAMQRQIVSGLPLSEDLLITLHRYFARVTTRSTPLQLLAGIAAATLGPFTQLRIAPIAEARVHVMPSWGSVLAITRDLVKHSAVRERMRFRFNESAMQRGGVLCYFTDQQPDGLKTQTPRYRVACLRLDKPLRAILSRAASNQVWSWTELTERLQSEAPDTTRETADAYVLDLLESGVLLDSLQPASLGERPERTLHAWAEGEPALSGLAADSQALLQITDRALPVADPSFDRAWDALEGHPWLATRSEQPDGRSKALRAGTNQQAVLRVSIQAGGLPADLVQQVADCIARTPFLWQLVRSPYYAAICDLFAEGTMGSRLPLMDVVFRIAKGGNLDDMRPLFNGQRLAPTASQQQTLLDRCVVQKLFDADLHGFEHIELPLSDLANALREHVPPFSQRPTIVEGMLRFVVLKGRPRVIASGFTPQVGRYGNRFLHWDRDDPMLRQQRDLWRQQEQDLAPCILAEITSGGGGRLRDLSQRPMTFRYQIVADGQPSVSAEFQIPISELSVTMSPLGPMLFWERRGVPVVARQGSALVPEAFSALVQVLQALDPQSMVWGLPIHSQQLPTRTARICIGDVILRPQSWFLPPNLQHVLAQPRKDRDDVALRSLITAWRARYGVPRIVRLGDAEHNAVDLDGPMALFELASMVEDQRFWVQEEFLHEGSIVVGPDGPLVAESVVQLRLPSQSEDAGPGRAQRHPNRARKPASGSQAEPTPAAASAFSTWPPSGGLCETSALRKAHVFPPGSPWLYLKLYYGAGLGSEEATRAFFDDHLLGRFVARLINECERQDLLSEFHFVRYADPEAHLRLRLRPCRLSSLQLLDRLSERIAAELHDGALAHFEVATYEREVDRYGGPALIAAAEQLFTADSRLCLRVLAAYYRDQLDHERDVRILVPVRALHTLYRAFGFDLAQRRQLFWALREQREADRSLRSAHDPLHKSALDATYRRYAKPLHDLVGSCEGLSASPPPDLACLHHRDIAPAFAAYEQSVQRVAATYHAAAAQSALSRPLHDILASLFHMHCNRLLGNHRLEHQVLCLAQRAAEAVLARSAKPSR